MLPKLTAKQARFVHEYLIDLNATQAAIRAGYKEKAARTVAAENLAKPNIQAAIQEAKEAREARTQITADRVVQQLARIAFADPADYQMVQDDNVTLKDTADIPAERRYAIQGYRRGKFGPEIVLADKMKAIELLGKHLGMWENSNDDKSEGIRVVIDGDAEVWSE